jgi:Protein of unknown function (DUF1501)
VQSRKGEVVLHATDHSRHARFILDRRRLLQIGGLGGLGLTLSKLFQVQALAESNLANSPRKIRSCILLFYYGGPSQLDTWDMKPTAPKEVRGEFKPIATNVPGIQVSEHLPRSARLMSELAVIRSMHHGMRNHNSAAVEALCGRTPLKGDLELLADDPNSFPCYGSVLSRLIPGRADLPSHVALPHVMHNVVTLPGQNAGFLGAAFNPFQITRDPNDPGFKVDELELPPDVDLARLDDRRRLLALVDRHAERVEQHSKRQNMTTFQQRAFDLLHSADVRRAFDLGRETPVVRDRYGRHTLGQSLLLARRLVEAGVRFINVNDKVHNGQLANWDSHENNFGRLKNDLLPAADQAYSALIEDLRARGLLDSTLVISLAEFGRTPKVNGNAGRDHWPDCFSVVLAGGGVHGGSIYGRSDRIAAYPAADPVTPADLAATLYWLFGLDTHTEVHDLTGRPYRVADGDPLQKLFA